MGLQNEGGDFMGFRVTREEQDSFRLPESLTALAFPDERDADRSRRINLMMEMMQRPAINGKFFEMLRVDQKSAAGRPGGLGVQ